MRKIALVVFLMVLVPLILAFTVKEKDGSNFPQYSITFTQGTVGATAAALTRECLKMHIKAFAGNSGNIYIGDSGVTADKGWELDGGEEVVIDSYTFNEVYVIGSAAGQKYAYICYN